jgi:hypothetical protein
MCENGATEPDVARALGVDRVTLWRWKAEHPDFCNAVKTAKAIADDRVEAALYERATGYSIETTKLFHEGGKVIAVEQLEHYPPDPTSMIFWLKNRRPLDWRDRREIAHENLGGKRERELTDEELDRELEAIEARRQELLALPAIPGELVKK